MRRSIERDDPCAARVAELEDENAELIERLGDSERNASELQARLAKREHDQVTLLNKLEAAKREAEEARQQAASCEPAPYVEPAPPQPAGWTPEAFLIALWFLLAGRLALIVWRPWSFLDDGLGALLVEIAFIGFAFLLLERWIDAEIDTEGWPLVLCRTALLGWGIGLGAWIFSWGGVINGDLHSKTAPELALLWLSLVLLLMVSPLCRWMGRLYDRCRKN
ncbi:MAG: hypothetical protein ABSD98_01840 [Candidatus Korobacteraceae bacterium]|jgi:hypothetical protein